MQQTQTETGRAGEGWRYYLQPLPPTIPPHDTHTHTKSGRVRVNN